MTFSEFVDAVSKNLMPAGARIVQRREVVPGGEQWWITFSKAACLYRVTYDAPSATLTLEKEQGSFVANSPSTWRFLDHRHPVDRDWQAALEPFGHLLSRFQPAGH